MQTRWFPLGLCLLMILGFSFRVQASDMLPIVSISSEQNTMKTPVQPIALDAPLVRIKDIARVQGVRDNQLYGLGLVIGLEGTGDGGGAKANVQMIANMLEKFGVTVSAEDLRLRNVAVVMVTADVASSVRTGDRVDVTISSIGDARSLQGGFLLQTPLEAANGQIYAAAQGPISIGGFNVRGGSGSVQRNHTTIGMIPGGAIIEQEIGGMVSDGEMVTLVLREPDFTTSNRLAQVVNQVYPDSAWSQDQATVRVQIPYQLRNQVVGFIAGLEELPIRPDVQARVIVNERTGTIVMGSGVRISTVAVAHGNLNVRIEPTLQISQPPPLAAGETVVAAEYDMEVMEDVNRLMVLQGTSSVDDLVEVLNTIGASPRDIISILQAIKAAGALYGELIIL